MTELYLIAHLVRGEPAFDIASQVEVEGEVWWIIPTSGHRAYPYETWELDGLGQGSDCGFPLWSVCEPPSGHPDHFSTAAAKGTGKITNLTALLGIGKREEVKRRV